LTKQFQTLIETETNTYNLEYMTSAKTKLSSIINDPSRTTLEKVQIWNTYVFQTFNKRPNTVHFPLLIPTTTKPFKADSNLTDQVKDVKLPISKSLEAKDVFDSVQDRISKSPKSTRYKAFFDTLGRIGEDHSQDRD
jgi:hypothetical protein